MSRFFEPMHKILPPGEKGKAQIEHFTIDQSSGFRALFRDGIAPGTYVRLMVGGRLLMSDTAMEQRTNAGVVACAKGDVLIAGLGIGLIIVPMLRNPAVKSITVIEKYQDVVDLVLPTLIASVPGADAKLKVIVQDVLTWKPGPKDLLPKYDVIYFDIWGDINTDLLAEMTTLKRRYARRLNEGGFMACWQQDFLRSQQRRSRRNYGFG